jgi:hypothetical protein
MEKSTLPCDNQAQKPPIGEVRGLLRGWGHGDRGALVSRTPIVYDELHRLAHHHMRGERPGQEMRFFGGLSVEETAGVLQVSPVTVMRDWSTAKAWLYRELTDRETDGS